MEFENSITGLRRRLADIVAEAIRLHPRSLKPIASELVQHDEFVVAFIGALLAAGQLNRFTALARKRFGYASPGKPQGPGGLAGLFGKGKGAKPKSKTKPAKKKKRDEEEDAQLGSFDSSLGSFDANLGSFDANLGSFDSSSEEEQDEEEADEEEQDDEGESDDIRPTARPILGIADAMMDSVENYFAQQ